MSEPERRKLWVKAGGRCTLCKRYLLEGNLTSIEVSLGEGAHIVGQRSSARSPRGLDVLEVAARDSADNILLACSNCHTEIDKGPVADIMTKEMLHQRKKEHEDEIRHQTGLTADRRTTVLRMQGTVRGAAINVDADAAATAVLRSSDRFPLFPRSYDQQGIEIDLRHLPGEERGDGPYYQMAQAAIDDVVAGKVSDGVKSNDISHLSVFAIARLPLLVYLGCALDDGINTDVYQRHRSSGDWMWPADGPLRSFAIDTTKVGAADAEDAVLVTNLSGTTVPVDIPAALADSPVFTLASDTAPHEDLISNPASLNELRGSLRRFFSQLEASRPQLVRLHVFGGMPVSAAVSLGQCLRARDLRPAIVLYDRVAGRYQPVMEF